MKVGASYYPELVPRHEWSRDLEAGREIGLSVLRCGEYAWHAFNPEADTWTTDWALDFLGKAGECGYEVIWCTPSAAPPPYIFDRWPDLNAVDAQGRRVPVGVRRNACPSHDGYRRLCAETASKLQQTIGGHFAITGWQVDNELAGDGQACWCDRCGASFRKWLQDRYATLERLNQEWQTFFWSQVYTDWRQIPIPLSYAGTHAPALKLAYRRFRSETWHDYYVAQYYALKTAGANRITTNFCNLRSGMPIDRWRFRDKLNAFGLSHYPLDPHNSRFELAVLRGPNPGQKPVWILEQPIGLGVAQNVFPNDTAGLSPHLRACAEAGAEYAIYRNLRQHPAGSEMDSAAILRHDGTSTPIAAAIKDAIEYTEFISPQLPEPGVLLLFFV